MSEETTLNIRKPDAGRFTKLRLNHAAREGTPFSQLDYLAYVTGIMEHIQGCAFCAENIRRHIAAEAAKKQEGIG